MSADKPDKSSEASSERGANALLGDLESIRTLLSEEDAAAQASMPGAETGEMAPSPDETADEQVVANASGAEEANSPGETAEDDVPLLDDVVDGTLDVDELQLQRGSEMDAQAGRPGMDDELFRALLGEEWRDAAAGILDQARSTIENRKEDWLPEDTDALNAALRVRIDETLHRWLRQAVLDGIDDLRAQLLRAITDELETSVRQHLNIDHADEDPHGE